MGRDKTGEGEEGGGKTLRLPELASSRNVFSDTCAKAVTQARQPGGPGDRLRRGGEGRGGAGEQRRGEERSGLSSGPATSPTAPLLTHPCSSWQKPFLGMAVAKIPLR